MQLPTFLGHSLTDNCGVQGPMIVLMGRYRLCEPTKMQLWYIPCVIVSVRPPDIITHNLTKTCLDAKTWNFAGAIIIIQSYWCSSSAVDALALWGSQCFYIFSEAITHAPSQHIVPPLIPIYSLLSSCASSLGSMTKSGVEVGCSESVYGAPGPGHHLKGPL